MLLRELGLQIAACILEPTETPIVNEISCYFKIQAHLALFYAWRWSLHPELSPSTSLACRNEHRQNCQKSYLTLLRWCCFWSRFGYRVLVGLYAALLYHSYNIHTQIIDFGFLENVRKQLPLILWRSTSQNSECSLAAREHSLFFRNRTKLTLNFQRYPLARSRGVKQEIPRQNDALITILMYLHASIKLSVWAHSTGPHDFPTASGKD